METFILLAVLFLVFGGCSRGCRRGVRRVRDRVLEGADDLQDALGPGDGGWRSRPAGRGTSAGGRGRGAGDREASTASRRPSPGGAARRGRERPTAGRDAERSHRVGADGADGGRPADGPGRMSPDDPRRLASLKDRFVRGELTMEEYEREVDRLDLRL